MSSNDMTFSRLVESLTPDTVGNLRRAVELGKWPDGRRLSEEQRATCMRAVLFWEQKYLPETMSKAEIKKVAEKKQKELGFTDKASMGKLMGAVMKELKDKADGGDVKAVVDELFM